MISISIKTGWDICNIATSDIPNRGMGTINRFSKLLKHLIFFSIYQVIEIYLIPLGVVIQV